MAFHSALSNPRYKQCAHFLPGKKKLNQKRGIEASNKD